MLIQLHDALLHTCIGPKAAGRPQPEPAVLLSQAVATRGLLDHNAKLKVVNKRGLTPLGEAVAAGHAECAAALVAAGADESHRPGGFSLLHVAAGVGKEATLMWLLDRGADVNDAANAEGYTPLHSAALGGDADCVRALVEAGGKLDALGADGATPAALVNQKVKAGKELLELLGGRDAVRRSAGSTAAAAQHSASPRGARDAGGVGPAAGPAAAFAAMSEADQIRRVRRWAEAPEDEFRQLLDGFQPEVRSRVRDVRKLLQLIIIHKARLYHWQSNAVTGPPVPAALNPLSRMASAGLLSLSAEKPAAHVKKTLTA